MKRMHLKRRRNKKGKIINRIIILFIILIISIIYIFKIFNERVLPQFISYSEIEIKKLISLLTNSTISEEIANNIVMDDLFIITKDDNGNIKSIDVNSVNVNKLLSEIARKVEKNLIYLEKGDIDKLDKFINTWDGYNEKNLKKGIVYEVPSGIIFNNVVLNNIFPKIPIKIELIGNVFCNLDTNIKSYGINNALLEVNIVIETEVRILLPFVSSSTAISSEMPIIIKLLEGEIPNYYFGDYLDSPVVSTN